ncbi:MAG: hypothetical protein JNM17_12565, partial [Archangium sp.]|nr:hypothetical protein [Archangium sp.]
MKRLIVLVVMVFGLAAFAQKPPQAPVPPTPPVPAVPALPPLPAMPAMGGFASPAGIPPALAAKVGISSEVQKKVRDLSFEANEQLISLESDLKRAQLDLEKTLAAQSVDESSVMNKLEVVGRAELAVRKNRMGLLVRIRKAIGAEAWERLQGEMTGPGGAVF